MLDNITHNADTRLLEVLIAESEIEMGLVRPMTYSPTLKNMMNVQITSPIKVLIVDDDNDTTELLRLILEPNSFDVFTSNNGEEGIELVRTLTPDVVVVDLVMPDMDGLKVCQEVRKFSTVPILVLTAFSKPNAAEEALNLGADDYLCKPMSHSVLIASLNKLARRGRQELHALKKNGSSQNS